jgi:uncharacterized protein YdaU (DUF1376 family)
MGNKDPAVLFYTSDFLTGVTDLTMEERGQYITLLCMQHQKGHLSEKTICLTVGNVSVDVLKKFKTDDEGLYFNSRMEEESEKRSKFIDSRVENGKKGGRKKSTSLTTSKPLAKHKVKLGDNDNENENIIKITKKDIDIFFENLWSVYPLKKGKAKIKDSQKEKLYHIGLEELSRAITRYDSEVEDKTYLQHGSTFFNSGYIDFIDENYQEKPKKPDGNPFKEKLKEAIRNEQNGSNGGNVGYQGGLSKLLQKPSGD